MASTNVVTAMNGNDRTTVKAVYKFKASNNDELSFKKGDIITVTQREDGGWWEGTSRETGKTGWFPSNYVTEVKETSPTGADVLSTTPLAGIDATTAAELLARQIENRQQVIRDLIEKEKEFVSELHNLQTTYLEPLLRTELMTISEYRQLAGNLDELIEVHRGLAAALDEEAPPKKAPREQRVGRVLLAHGSNVKGAHLSYWANHPKAVCILERHRSALDAFMESQGATKPGLMTLTTGLSKPFRQLERYASVSQELEQHQEDDHIDRGDAQRSISFYKNVAAECAKHKKQKELELEVLTGTIRGWEGEELTTLGDIIHMGSVAVGTDHKDRYFVLFPTNLLILSVSARMSAFIYEGKLPLSGIAVNRLEDSETIKNSFEITGPMIDRIVVVNQTRTEALRWVEILRQQIKCARQTSALSTTSPQQQQQPPLPPHVSFSPPFQLLTDWIRETLIMGILTLETLHSLLKIPGELVLHESVNRPVKYRTHKVEYEIFRDTFDIHKKREACMQANNGEEENNPYGFIRYFDDGEDEQTTNSSYTSTKTDGDSSDEITLLFPSNLQDEDSDASTVYEEINVLQSPLPEMGKCFSSSSSLSSTDVNNMKWCKTFPGHKSQLLKPLLCHSESNLRVLRHPLIKLTSIDRHSMPCINLKLSEEASSSSSSSSSVSSEMAWIDKTPSESSLLLPYCPPQQLDYEDFPVDTYKNRMRRSLSPERELMIVPYVEEARVLSSPAIPLRTGQKTHVVEVVARISPPPTVIRHVDLSQDNSYLLRPSYSSDSGLADVSAVVERTNCPPDLLQHLKKPQQQQQKRRLLCGHGNLCQQNSSSVEEDFEPLSSSSSIDCDIPVESLSRDTREDDSDDNSTSEEQQFKSGMYAHWWMKAYLHKEQLNAISEEELGTLI